MFSNCFYFYPQFLVATTALRRSRKSDEDYMVMLELGNIVEVVEVIL